MVERDQLRKALAISLLPAAAVAFVAGAMAFGFDNPFELRMLALALAAAAIAGRFLYQRVVNR